MFSQNGNRVLYVETPVHLLGLDILPEDPFRFFRFLKGCRRAEENLYVATLPILLPFFQMSHAINSANQIVVRNVLRRWIRSLDLKDLIVWIYTPFSEPALNGIPHAAAIYECVDEFRAAKGFVRAETVGRMEDLLLEKVDVTIVTHQNLVDRRAAICKNTFCVPNGADTDLFGTIALDESPASPLLADIPRPRIGFVGHLQYWIDFKLIRFLAERRPEWSFVLVGPVGPLADTGQVKTLKNVRFLGRQPQGDVPRLLKGFDICLNPYHTGELANHCSPLKLYEYLAAGKPVVSTQMPEALKFGEDVLVGESYGEILTKCEALVKQLPEPRSCVEARVSRARQHSWNSRFVQVNSIVERVMEKPDSEK
jgi:glycosyltransferase involved in cell wall biosynthesis